MPRVPKSSTAGATSLYRRLADSIDWLFSRRLGRYRPLLRQGSVQSDGHGRFTAQQVTPAQLDFRRPLAFANQANAFGIDGDCVVGTVDGDPPLEFFVEDSGHLNLR
jgi:hypothetical protein